VKLERLRRHSHRRAHSLTLSSLDANANSPPSRENATAMTHPQWPSSVYSVALQVDCTFGSFRI
jgi:hypothetical protein